VVELWKDEMVMSHNSNSMIKCRDWTNSRGMSSWTDDLTRRGAILHEPPWNRQTRYSNAKAIRPVLKVLTSNTGLLGIKYYQIARALFMGNKVIKWVMNPAFRISVWCHFERQITAGETLKNESCKYLVSTVWKTSCCYHW